MTDVVLTEIDLNIENRLADHSFAIEWAKAQDDLIKRLQAMIKRRQRMTTKPKIKPVKAWAVAEEECDGNHTLAPWRMYHRRSEARAIVKKRRDYYRVFGDKIIPVLITPIEPKRSAKK